MGSSRDSKITNLPSQPGRRKYIRSTPRGGGAAGGGGGRRDEISYVKRQNSEIVMRRPSRERNFNGI